MKIEIWSDFVCPFCYIGKRQLEEALSQFPHKDQVTVEFKSYELRPDAPKDIGKSMAEMLADRQGSTVEESEMKLAGIAERAASAGLLFRFETMIPTNTFHAHRLVKFSETKAKQAEVTELLLDAYFRQSKHIGDIDILTDIGVEAGLDREETAKVLQDMTAFEEEVRHDQAEAKQIGVRGVPFFFINRKHTIAGSQSPEKFLEFLHTFWAEEMIEQNNSSIKNIDGDGCIDGNCAVPTKEKN